MQATWFWFSLLSWSLGFVHMRCGEFVIVCVLEKHFQADWFWRGWRSVRHL